MVDRGSSESRPGGHPRGREDKSRLAALRTARVSYYARGRAQILHAARLVGADLSVIS